jgi:hypothetical protein
MLDRTNQRMSQIVKERNGKTLLGGVGGRFLTNRAVGSMAVVISARMRIFTEVISEVAEVNFI